MRASNRVFGLFLAAWFPALLPLLLPGMAPAHPAVPVPAFVRPAAIPLDALPPPEQAGNGTYWLLIDNQEDLPTRSSYGHYATRILSEAGLQEASQISVDLDPGYQRLDWHRITLWRQGKPAELLPRLKPDVMRREQEWEWGLLDGRQTQLFSLEDVRVGDVVEYSYTLVGDNPIFKGMPSGMFWIQFAAPAARVAYRILHDPGRKVRLLARNGAPDALEGRAGNRSELSWSLEKVGSMVQDDDAPSWYDAFPSVQWSGYATWADVVDWALPLYKLEETLSPDLEKVVARLRGLPPRDRIRQALRLVQDEVRYLGLEMGSSSHRPNPPDKVYARRFGDCKDKALLFCALMGRLGVDAAPVLVNSRGLRDTADQLPSPLAFDHVIARVVFEGAPYWFDPTQTQQRGDPLAFRKLDYGKGLPIVPGGSGFEEIHPGPLDGGSVWVRQAFILPAPDSAASMEVVSTFTGAEADHIRSLFATESREKLAKDYLNYYARAYPAIAAAAPILFEEDSAGNGVVLREAYRVDSLCTREDGKGRLGCSIYPQEAAHWVAEPDRRIRTSPYGLAYPKHVKQTITLRLPVAPGVAPDVRTVSHPDFRFSWSEVSEGKVVKLDYEYQALSDHVSLDRFPAYLAALDTLEDNMGATVYLPGYPAGPGFAWSSWRPNQFLVLFLLVSLGAGVWAAGRLARMEPSWTPRRDFSARPLGGLLFLLGVALAARATMRGWHLYGMAFLLDQEKWNALTLPGGAGYHPLWTPILLVDVLGSVAAFVCMIVVIPLFLRRHRSFPRAFIVTVVATMALATLEAFGFRLVPVTLSEMKDVGGTDAWVRAMIVGAAWISYVTLSARVRETFVFPLQVPPEAEVPAREKVAGNDPASA